MIRNTKGIVWLERLGLLLLFTLLAAKTLCLIYDQDLWFHMKGAQVMLQRGFLATDPFSYTASDHPWVSSGWLSSMLLYGLYRMLGPAGVIFLVAFVSGAMLWILLRIWKQEGGSPCTGLIAGALMVLAVSGRLRPRGDLFSLLLMAVFMWVLLSYRRSRNLKLLVLLPLLTMLWANLHTGFVAGLLLIGLFLAGEAVETRRENGLSRREWLLGLMTLMVSAVATLLNPYGVKVWTFGMEIGRSAEIARAVAEWHPPLAPPVMNLPMLVPSGLLLLLGIIMLLRRSRMDMTSFLWLAVFLLMALKWRRQVAPFAITAMISSAMGLKAGAMAPSLKAHGTQVKASVVAAAASVSLLLLVLAWSLFQGFSPSGGDGMRIGLGVDRSQVGLGAAEFIEQHQLPGPMFNTYSIGGALIWKCWPRLKVFIDGRADVYGEAQMLRYFELLGNPKRFRALLDKENIRLVVVGPPDPIDGITAELSRLGGWHLVYFDDTGLVYLKETSQTRPLIRRIGYRWLNPTGNPSLEPAKPEERDGLRAETIRSLRESRESVRSLVFAGLSYLRLGETETAWKYARKALRGGPAWPEAHLVAAITLWEKNEREQALEHFQVVTYLRPENGEDLLNLAYALSELGRTGEADQHFARGYYLIARKMAVSRRDREALEALSRSSSYDSSISRKALSDPAFSRLKQNPGFEQVINGR